MNEEKGENLTPMEKQYREIKDQYADCILLYRMGDFYEGFDNDAVILSEVLNIALTSRSKGEYKRKMAGVPWHALDDYLYKLVKAGYKVAIAEQLEDPAAAKGIVKRGVIKVVTPGTIDSLGGVEADRNNYILSILDASDSLACAYIDVLTGEFKTFEIFKDKHHRTKLNDQLAKLTPSEVLLISKSKSSDMNTIAKTLRCRTEMIDLKTHEVDSQITEMLEDLGIANAKGLGYTSNYDPKLVSASCLFRYIKNNQGKNSLSQPQIQNITGFMQLDHSTIKNLDLVYNSASGSDEYTLYGCLNLCKTPLGKRLLRRRILSPFIEKGIIQEKIDIVEKLNNSGNLVRLRVLLSGISDIQRLAGKIGARSIGPKELIQLKNSLSSIPEIYEQTEKINILKDFFTREDLTMIAQLNDILANSLLDNPSTYTKESNIFRDSYNEKIEELRNIKNNSNEVLEKIKRREVEQTGINNLKIKFNKVFGYYIEVSNSQTGKIPEHYIRKQTLVNAERYITQELKVIEEQILNSEQRLSQLEFELYLEFCESLLVYVPHIKSCSEYIAELDLLSNFAHIANTRNYVKPVISEAEISITNSRHPIVELNVEEYIANDFSDPKHINYINIITGPNMSGKSTFIRQVAIIQLMFQIGCYVPADSASIKVVDRVFTRIGASDNIAQGESTFMVEMTEVANILNNATKDSLVILDEVGRGTSTYDGLSLAWSIVEYIALDLQCLALFATHYHELVKMEEDCVRVRTLYIDVFDDGSEVKFLYKIKEGSISKSYGIHVANIAGVPEKVIDRSKTILMGLEKGSFFNLRQITEMGNRRKKILKSSSRNKTKIQQSLI